MAVAHLLKLVLHWSGYGEEGTLQWYYGGSEADHSPGALTDAVGEVIAEWTDNETPSSKNGLLGMLQPQQSVDQVSLYEYTTAPGPATSIGRVAPAGWTGFAGNMYTPLQTCLVASTVTAHAGASYRGRQYFPATWSRPLGASALVAHADADSVRSLAATLGTDAQQALSSSLAVAALAWGVYSPTKGLITPITDIHVDNKMDTQRRREAQLQPDYVSSGGL